eukprot:scaffold54_cov158-Amphora_coffeaeformis.AAC.14
MSKRKMMSTSDANATGKKGKEKSSSKKAVNNRKGGTNPVTKIVKTLATTNVNQQTETKPLAETAATRANDGPKVASGKPKDAPGNSSAYFYIQHLSPNDIILPVSHVPVHRPTNNERFNHLILQQRPMYARTGGKNHLVRQIVAQVELSGGRWVYPVNPGQWRLAQNHEVDQHVHHLLQAGTVGSNASHALKKRKAPYNSSMQEQRTKEARKTLSPIPVNGGMGYPFPPPPFMPPVFPFMFPHVPPPFGMYRPPIPYGPSMKAKASGKEMSSKQPPAFLPFPPLPPGMFPPVPYGQATSNKPCKKVVVQESRPLDTTSSTSQSNSNVDDSDDTEIIVDLTWSDVVCDAHENTCLRKGDWHLRSIIMPLLTKYQEATEKIDLIQIVVDAIHKVGGRFLKSIRPNGSDGCPQWRLAMELEQSRHIQREFYGMVMEAAGTDPKWKEKYKSKIREELPWLHEAAANTQADAGPKEHATKSETSDSASDAMEATSSDDSFSKTPKAISNEGESDGIEVYDIVYDDDDNFSGPSREPQASQPQDYGMSRQLELTQRSLLAKNPECRDLYVSFYDYDLFAPLGHSQDFVWLSESSHSTGEEEQLPVSPRSVRNSLVDNRHPLDTVPVVKMHTNKE